MRLLGTVEVRDGRGDAVTITGTACRAVLTMLALRPGAVVLTDELVDGLWAVELPGDPAAAVQVTMSRLRRALGDDRSLVTRHPAGYSLDVPAGAVDVGRAEAALSEGRRALDDGDFDRAAAVLAGALRQWRGQPLAQLVDLPFAMTAVSRLHTLRLSLAEARNAALLACGRAVEVLEDTAELIEGDPWREELVAQFMTALYRTNRQVEALSAYARLSSALRRDFGIDPSPPVRLLHDRILRHDPALLGHEGAAAPAPAATSLPEWFRLALDTDTEGDPHLRCRLLLALGEAQHHAGEPGWRETLLQAADVALELGDDGALARAALGGAVGWTLDPGAPDQRRLRLLDRALAGTDELDGGVRARLLAARGAELAFTATLDERLALSDEALRLARASGEPATLLAVLNQRFNAVWAPETLADRRRAVREAARLADDTSHPIARALASAWQMAAAVETGDLADADRHLDRFTTLAAELDVPLLRWGAVLHRSWRRLLDGDLIEAERLCHEALAVGTKGNRPEAGVVAITQLAGIRWAQGRLGEEVAPLGGLVEALPHFGALQAWHALALHESGSAREAAGMLIAAREAGTLRSVERNQLCLAALMIWGELACATGDADGASVLIAQLAPFEEQFAFTGNAVYGPVTLALGQLALVVGDVDLAARHLADAAARSAAMPAPFFEARARDVLARLS